MRHRPSSPTPLQIAENLVVKNELKPSNGRDKGRSNYWDRMSQPRQANKVDKPPKPKQSNRRTVCISRDFCPPRIDQLSSPTVPRLAGLLQTYHQILTPDCVSRVVTLIHSKVAEPAKRKVYTKRQKKKAKKKPLKKCTKQQMQLRWLKKQADITSELIMRQLRHADIRKKAPNYRQVILAIELLRVLHARGTKQYVRNVLDYCDHLAVIADTEWEPFRGTGDIDTELESELTQIELAQQQKKVVRYIISEESLLDTDSELESLATVEQRTLATLGSFKRLYKDEMKYILESEAELSEYY